jgi:hypothetical protein
MSFNIITYSIYFSILLFVVLYVGAMLYKNGKPFLINTFSGNTILADAVNRVLLAGYYLVNIGYTILFLKIAETIHSYKEMLNILGLKVGAIVLTLGIMHCINIISLVAIGKNRKQKHSINQ